MGTVKLAGLPEYSNIEIAVNVGRAGELWDWYKKTLAGNMERKDISIIILNNTNNPVVRYNVRNAWPCAWHGPELEALENGTAREVIEIAHEGFTREGAD